MHRTAPARRRFLALLGAFSVLASLMVFVASAPPALATVPAPTITNPGTVNTQIGGTATFTVSFDNAATTAVGYGPYLDVVVPNNGIDGNNSTSLPLDGLSFTGATYLGANVAATVVTLTDDGFGSGQATHPITGATVAGEIGDTLVVLELPFGSYTPNQPPADIDLAFSVSDHADEGAGLDLDIRPWFRFGNSPTGTTPILGAVETVTVIPSVVAFDKTWTAIPAETTGPNYPRTYTLTATTAPGQTVTDVDITDELPVGARFVSVTPPAGASVVSAPAPGELVTAVNRTLTVNVPSFTGTTSVDVVLTAPYRDADSNFIVDALTGAPDTITNTADLLGDWTPIDPRDPGGTDNVNLTAGPVDSPVRSLDTTLSLADLNAGPVLPGDVFEHTATGWVSDYFAFENLNFTATLTDGWRFDPTFDPEITISAHGTPITGTLLPAEYTVTVDTPGTGQSTLDVDVPAVISRLSAPSVLRGGCVDDPPLAGDPDCAVVDDGATSIQITYRAETLTAFSDDFPSGNANVVQGDSFGVDVEWSGDVIDVATGSATGSRVGSPASGGSNYQTATITHDVYAINGVLVGAPPFETNPGDEVTYRLRVANPIGRAEDMTLDIFLPLPIFDATEVTTYTDSDIGIPAAANASHGPDHNLDTLAVTPALSTDGGDNRVIFNVGDFIDPAGQPVIIDLLYTVTASSQRYADGLLLTSLAQANYANTDGDPLTAADLVQVLRAEPVILDVTKGVIALDSLDGTITGPVGPQAATPVGTSGFRFGGTIDASGLDTTPIDADATGLEGLDEVSFAIVARNTGNADAYDLTFTDTLPADLAFIPGSLNVSDGAGNPIGFTDLGGGLFGSGIRLDDSPTAGSIGAAGGAPGADIVVITYDAQFTSAADWGASYQNTARLTAYAGVEGGPNFLAAPLADTASTDHREPTIELAIDTTSEAHTSGLQGGSERVAIGEVVRYRTWVEIPQGSVPGSYNIRANLPNNLMWRGSGRVAIVSEGSLLVSGVGPGANVVGNETNLASINPTSPISPTNGFFAPGTDPVFDLGSILNAEGDANREFVLIEFNVQVLNQSANQANTNNNVSTEFRDNTTVIDGSPNRGTRVVEPAVAVDKTAGTPAATQAGEVTDYTITVTNPTGGTRANAFEVRVTDTVDAHTTLNVSSIAVSTSGGVVGITNNSAGDTVDITFTTFPTGGTATITYETTADTTAGPTATIDNTATARWTSLPGPQGTTSNPTGQATWSASSNFDGERDGSGGVNDYIAQDTATVTLNNPVVEFTIDDTAYTTFSGSPQAAVIGEIVRYRAEIDIPAGTIPDASLSLQIPSGMLFLNDGTARFAIVSDAAPGLTMSNITGGWVAGDGTTVDTHNPTTLLDPAWYTVGPNPGDNVTVTLGTIVNTETDADGEGMIVEYNAIVLNDSGNNRFDAWVHTALVASGIDILEGDASPSVFVAEPVPTSTITPSITEAEAGQPVTFTATFGNDNVTYSSPMNDVTWTMVLDPEFADITLADISVSQVGTFPALLSLPAPRTIQVTSPAIDPGESFTISVTTEPEIVVGPSSFLTASVDADWSSLPGDGTTTTLAGSAPGAAGTLTGERTATGGVNNYTLSDAANIQVPDAQLDLVIAATDNPNTSGSDVTPGEVVTYQTTITLPEGTTSPFTFTPTLSPDMTWVSFLPVDLSGLNGTADPWTQNPDGTIDFGQIVVTADGDPSNNSIVIRHTAVVDDVPANIPGRVLDHDVAALGETDTEPVTVRRIDLAVSNPSAPAAAAPGDTVDYPIRVDNNGDQTAYGAVVTVVVPDHTSAPSAPGEGWTCAPGTDPGDTCTLTLAAPVAPGVPMDLTFPITVDSVLGAGIDTTALSFAVADDGSGGSDLTPADNSTAPNLTLVAAPDLVTTVTHTSGTEPGDLAIFDVTFDNAGTQDASGATATFTIPDHVRFNTANSDPGWACLGTTPGNTCTFFVGDFAVADPVVTAAVAFRVDDPLPANPTTPTALTVVITDDGSNGADLTPADNTDVDTFTLGGAPDLGVVASWDSSTYTVGDTATLVLFYSNSIDATRGASGVEISVALPPGVTTPTPGAGWACSAGSCTTTIGTLEASDSGSIDLQMLLPDPIPAAMESITATATISDDGNNGTDTNPSNNTSADTATVDAAPDLTLTITGPGSTSAGANYSFNVGVTNNGDQDTTGVSVTVDIPDHVTVAPGAAGFGWVCTDTTAPGTCTFTVGPLGALSAVFTAFPVVIDSPLPAGVEDTTLSGSVADDLAAQDPTAADRSDSATVTIAAAPDLTLTMSAAPAAINDGDQTTITYEWANVGTQDATGVEVTFDVPAGATLVSDTGGAVCTGVSPTVCVVTLGNVAAGDSGSFTATYVTDDPFNEPGNTLIASGLIDDDNANGADPVPGNNSAGVFVDVTPAADLAVTFTSAPPSLLAGEDHTFEIRVDNLGPNTEPTVTVTVDLADLAWDGVVPPDWMCTAGTGNEVVCTLTNLAAGASRTFTVTGVAGATPPPSINVTAEVSGTVTDPDLSNNDASQVVGAAFAADLTPTISALPSTWRVEVPADITVGVTNLGPSPSLATPANPITVSVPLPTGVTITAWNPGAGWVCDTVDATIIDCGYETDLAVGATPAVTVTVDVADPAVGDHTLTATVTPGDTTDPNTANDTATTSVTVLPQANLSVTKTPVGTFVVGETGRYDITVTNAGPSTGAAPITVTDTLVAGLTFAGVDSTDAWTCSAVADPDGIETVTCVLNETFPMSRVSTFGLLVNVDASVDPNIDNTATVTSGTEDPDTSDNTDSTGLVPVTPTVDLEVFVTNSAPLTIGGTATWTVRVGNNGPSDTTGDATLTIDVPDGKTPTVTAAGAWVCTTLGTGDVECTHPPMVASGLTDPIEISVPVAAGDYPSMSLSATVVGASGDNEPDTANNTVASPAPVTPIADIAVDVAPGAGDPTRGGSGSVVIDLDNLGPTPHPGPLTVTATFDPGLAPTGGTVTGGGVPWVCTVAAQTLTCTATGPFPPGDLGQITATVDYADDGDLGVTVVVDGEPVDPDLNNNTALLTVPVAGLVDFTITKDALGDAVNGQTMDWRITVTNNGPSDTSEPTTVIDTLPAGLTYVAAQAPAGFDCTAPSAATVTCVFPGVWPAGTTHEIILTTAVDAPEGTQLVNRVLVNSEATAVAEDDAATAVLGGTTTQTPLTPPPSTPSPAPAGGGTGGAGSLPVTGGESTPMVSLALALMVLGVTLLGVSRRIRVAQP